MDIASIIEKIREEVNRRHQSLSETLSTELRDDAASLGRRIAADTPHLRTLISSAETHADIAAQPPPMVRFRGLLRSVAILAGKIVIYMSSFITEKQRAFNKAVVQSLRAITDSIEGVVRDVPAEVRRGVGHEMKTIKEEISLLRNDHNRLARRVRGQKLEILDQQRRLGIVGRSEAKRPEDPLAETYQGLMSAEEERFLDALSFAFTNRFRGTREQIKKRQDIYLPYIAATAQATILDLGCGRGEWLELLKERGYRGKGVDLSTMMVKECLEQGLDVTEADLIEYLEDQAGGSIGAVTGFHIIEHLPFRTLVRLLSEALRVLEPGGLVIFETPNPANILVSAYDFYRDPTHRNPIHPDTLTLTAEEVGFVRAGSYFIDGNSEHPKLIRTEAWKFDNLRDYVAVSRDYVFIGFKEDNGRYGSLDPEKTREA